MDDLLVKARSALLDALEALTEQHDSIVVVGAQAIYLHSGDADVAIAEATKDSDLAVDPRALPEDPLLEEAMKRAGFYPNVNKQPGAWLNPAGIPVDLMVPDALSQGGRSHRGARIPPHSNQATRRTVGLEAAVVDNELRTISALDPDDTRTFEARVAGPAALLIAKVHKIHERLDQPDRLNDKDAHDVYRLLKATTDTAALGSSFQRLLTDPVSKMVTEQALEWLPTLFADGPDALGSVMAGRAEEGIGDPDLVAASVAALAADVLAAVADASR
ncbi:hypothetical protein P5V93_22785 [Mycobacteroides abscessus subsp. abscessus]|uniref:hypothetical protein n=2 Tax=Mycobacteriaceae TaxID=1762 RepID=UPI00037A370C|nr:hypothetical protein [Mycobacteroides abscessus]AWG48141.1 hypothetical protein DDT48_01080 [Mycobacteroides abscessus]MBN7300431.1 hypothetical protein [Mycobacteroides abscessus subsp. bolletii]MBN7498238.1 hypothetical protein [Mycobacteroides abscessus subsp. abscessus]MDB2191100.1 hypothetical protein [Mycobacteroides abscessus subsp. abscessus]MDM2174788.1 hypothetical protein [Mycobacteroides abscessus]